MRPELVRRILWVRRKSATWAWPGTAWNGDVSASQAAGCKCTQGGRASTREANGAESGRERLARESSMSRVTGSFSSLMRAIDSLTPTASHISNGPSSQLKPARIATSIEGASSATSPMRSAAKFQSEDRKGPEEGRAALSVLLGLFASSSRRRSGSVAVRSSPFRAPAARA